MNQLDQQFAISRPQLLRLAAAFGFAADTAEDIVQETYLEAWRHRNRLVAPDGAEAWLKAICRNICLRTARTLGRLQQREQQLDLRADEALEMLADSAAPDPVETLSRTELVQVVDHALSYLPDVTRAALILCYVDDMPQREVAARLNISLKALETRLLRGRRELRDVLYGPLRAEALALDLLSPPGDEALGWRTTSAWCHNCGKEHLRGIFEPMANGRVNLRLRCPRCSPGQDVDMIDTAGYVPLAGLRSFKPAIKRTNMFSLPRYRRALTHQDAPCLACGNVTLASIQFADAIPLRLGANAYYVVLDCPECQQRAICSVGELIVKATPLARDFAEAHPRWIGQPEILTVFAGHPALRIGMVDLASATRCIVFAEPQTLITLGAFQE